LAGRPIFGGAAGKFRLAWKMKLKPTQADTHKSSFESHIQGRVMTSHRFAQSFRDPAPFLTAGFFLPRFAQAL
jgi:hypothetical protein